MKKIMTVKEIFEKSYFLRNDYPKIHGKELTLPEQKKHDNKKYIDYDYVIEIINKQWHCSNDKPTIDGNYLDLIKAFKEDQQNE